MSHLRSFALVARHAFAQTLRGKRLLLLVLLVGLPVLISMMIAGAKQKSALFDVQMWALVVLLRGVVPLAALFLGVAVVGDEIEGRTITFLFTRPVPRWLLYLARYSGAALAFLLLLGLSVAASGMVFARHLPVDARAMVGTGAVAAAGFLVYGAFFAMLRLFLQRALLVGFLIGFIVETVILSMPPGGFGTISIGHHLALLQVDVFPGAVAIGEEIIESLGPDETVAGSIRALCWILGGSLLVGAVRITRSEIRIPSSVA